MDIEILMHTFCDYLHYMRGLSPKTIRDRRLTIQYFKRHACISSMEEITEKNVREFFIYGRIERNWKPHTFIHFHMCLGTFFQWCIAHGHLQKNFLTDIEIPKTENRLPVKLTKQDATKLLEVVYNYPYDYKFLRYRNHAIFAMFVFAGLRKTELLNLKLTDVDFDNFSIFVRGKGNKDRIVPMSFTLAQTLRRFIEERKAWNKTCPYFFTSLHLNVGYTEAGLNRLIVKIRTASGLKFSAHKLRHTFATLMMEGGCDIYSLSKMMGHSNITTTTIYLSATAEHLRSQVGKHPLNDLIRLN